MRYFVKNHDVFWLNFLIQVNCLHIPISLEYKITHYTYAIAQVNSTKYKYRTYGSGVNKTVHDIINSYLLYINKYAYYA